MNDIDVVKAGRFDELEKRYRVIDEADQAPIAKLGLYATTAMQHLKEHEQTFQELRNHGFLCTDIISRGGEWYERAAARISATLDEAVKSRTIRTVDTLRIGSIFLDAILSLMARRTGAASQETIENDVRVLMDLYLFGLSSNH